jgi:hypothetical protein
MKGTNKELLFSFSGYTNPIKIKIVSYNGSTRIETQFLFDRREQRMLEIYHHPLRETLIKHNKDFNESEKGTKHE